MGQETGRPDGEERAQESSQWTEPQAGGQGERIEGTLTNGGSQRGERSFAPRTPGHAAPEGEGEGGGTMSGQGQKEGGEPASGQQGDQDRPDADYDDRGYG